MQCLHREEICKEWKCHKCSNSVGIYLIVDKKSKLFIRMFQMTAAQNNLNELWDTWYKNEVSNSDTYTLYACLFIFKGNLGYHA